MNRRRGPTYNTARLARIFDFILLWGIQIFFLYCMRRIDCPKCGVTDGKNQTCNAYRLFLAR